MHQLTSDQLGWFVEVMKFWAEQIPVVQALVIMIGIDIVTGWLLAIAKHTLNSSTSFAGMCKKVAILLFVVVGIVLEPFANGLPLSVIFATGFLLQELLSITENMAALGVPIPQSILDVLEKLHNGKKTKLDQKSMANTAQERNTAAQDDNTRAIDELKTMAEEVVSQSSHAPPPPRDDLDPHDHLP